MNYLGIYHSDYARQRDDVCDAPCITKGRMSLRASDAASEGDLIALAAGRLRNQGELAETLGCPGRTSLSMLALRAYQRWGEDYPERLEGPVMSCVLDQGKDVLVLARDRMGEMPLFYAWSGSSLAFSDHPDTLIRSGRTEAAMDADGLRELFGLGPARTPGRTCYRDMREVEPGCALVVREGRASVKRYFRIEDAPHEADEARTVERVRALLEACVADVSPLRPAVMLSGGLDSTALTALMARGGQPVHSFSVDYLNNERDFEANAFRPEMDAPYVMEAIRAFGTQHRTVTLQASALAGALGRAVALRGFPGMADIDTSLLLFAREIGRLDRTVVSGECGDEVFGGYPWFRGVPAQEGFPWSGSLPLREGLLRPEWREKLDLRAYVRQVYEAKKNEADPGPGWEPEERRLRTLQRLCFQFFMPNLQERATRMCEGAGVRVLTPLCDDRLVRYVYNVPWRMKFMGGQEKGLFRAAVADLLPEKLLRRTKSPYPKTCSPEYGALARQMALGMAEERDAPIFDVVDRSRVRALARSELNPAETPWFGQLMAGPQLLAYLWQVNRWMEERRVRIVG